MITYIKGNLLNTHCKAIAHGCNAQGVMGSGVAKQIKDAYPEAYKAYLEGDFRTLGNVIQCTIGDKIILNCITQKYYGKVVNIKYVSYNAVYISLNNISNILTKLNITDLAMPKIGCGLGNGKWEIIEEMIKNNLKNIEVYVYEL